MNPAPRFLIIRRDNIGDLVCVTPLVRALRARFPEARLCALVNSYNRAAVDHHPDLDSVYSYTKAKHRGGGRSLAGIYLDRLRLILALRRERFDYAILAAPGYQARSLALARMARCKRILGFVEAPGQSRKINAPVPYSPPPGLHEVEDVFRLVRHFGIEGPPPPALVVPDAGRALLLERRLADGAERAPLVGLHISARKPSQRWPAERFAALARELHRSWGVRFILFWSPGDPSNPRHPGDDAKALELLQALPGVPVAACPTEELAELIAGLSLCAAVICSDGGAMHLAAALGKPILCLFGQSDALRWHPWGVPYQLLQAESRDVADISVAEAVAGFGRLWG